MQLLLKIKGIFLTILLQQKFAPSYEFLLVFRLVRVWDRKSARWAQVGMVCQVG